MDTVHQSGKHVHSLYASQGYKYIHYTPFKGNTYILCTSVGETRTDKRRVHTHSMRCTFTTVALNHSISGFVFQWFKITTQTAVAEDGIVWYNRHRQSDELCNTDIDEHQRQRVHRQTLQ